MTTNRKRLLALGLLTLFWTSCSTDNIKNTDSVEIDQDTTGQINTLTDIADYLSVKTETFNIDPTKDTLINCQKGTMLYLPAKSLQFQDGSSPTELVQVDIKECYSLADFIGDNLTTTSGDRILETGGMINISLSSNGKQLTMQDGKEYALYFPRNGQKEDMQLFYGNHATSGQMDWTLAPALETEQIEFRSESELIDQSLYTCNMVISSYTSAIADHKVEWELKDNKQTMHDYFSNNFSATDDMKKEFCSQNYRADFDLKFDVSGKVSEILFENTTTPEYDKIISDFFYSLPPLDVSTMAKHSPNVTYGLEITGRTEIDRDKYNKQFKQKYASFKDKAVTKIDQAELNYFVQTATKFGWINCDRFWNTPDEKIDFFVKSKSPNDAKILIAFKDINSVMQGTLNGDRFVFSNIPVNQGIKVIGISYDKGNPSMAVAETTTDKDGFKLTEFNEFTLAQLEAELNKMN
jgi:hypothetical protein